MDGCNYFILPIFDSWIDLCFEMVYHYWITNWNSILLISMKKDYPVIEVPPSGKKQWSGGAYSLFFMYTKHKGNFVLKGYSIDIDSYMEKEGYTHYLCNRVLFGGGEKRNRWKFWKEDVGIFNSGVGRSKSKRLKQKIHMRYYSFSKKDNGVNLYFKRLPHKWIPEFDLF